MNNINNNEVTLQHFMNLLSTSDLLNGKVAGELLSTFEQLVRLLSQDSAKKIDAGFGFIARGHRSILSEDNAVTFVAECTAKYKLIFIDITFTFTPNSQGKFETVPITYSVNGSTYLSEGFTEDTFLRILPLYCIALDQLRLVQERSGLGQLSKNSPNVTYALSMPIPSLKAGSVYFSVVRTDRYTLDLNEAGGHFLSLTQSMLTDILEDQKTIRVALYTKLVSY